MTTINNLTIEQMREIVDVAPTWAIWWCVEKKKFLDFIPCSSCLVVEDLRTAIAKHDLKQCQHGYDIACLICGFGNENGVRFLRKQIESDEVTDIRNHVSPSTIIKDLEAERHG